LVDEARRFYSENSGKTAVQAIGCKELLPYLREEEPLNVSVERLKQETRRFAKRQLTWFRQNAKIIWIYADECNSYEELVARASKELQSHLNLQ
jgi:tRNA dimethylallyltransferase